MLVPENDLDTLKKNLKLNVTRIFDSSILNLIPPIKRSAEEEKIEETASDKNVQEENINSQTIPEAISDTILKEQ